MIKSCPSNHSTARHAIKNYDPCDRALQSSALNPYRKTQIENQQVQSGLAVSADHVGYPMDIQLRQQANGAPMIGVERQRRMLVFQMTSRLWRFHHFRLNPSRQSFDLVVEPQMVGDP